MDSYYGACVGDLKGKELMQIDILGSLTYVKGDATSPIGQGSKILAHVVNTVGKWGAGFTRALDSKWRKPSEYYQSWYKQKTTRPGRNDGTRFKLGSVQHCSVGEHLWVVNMIAQVGVRSRAAAEAGAPPPIGTRH